MRRVPRSRYNRGMDKANSQHDDLVGPDSPRIRLDRAPDLFRFAMSGRASEAYNRGMSKEPDGKSTRITRRMRQHLIVTIVAIGLVSGGCQGCARPKVNVALVKKGMTIAAAEAILGKASDVDKLGKPFSPGQEIRMYKIGDNNVFVAYKNGIVDDPPREHPPQPWWRLW
jgi:hypothetical protein